MFLVNINELTRHVGSLVGATAYGLNIPICGYQLHCPSLVVNGNPVCSFFTEKQTEILFFWQGSKVKKKKKAQRRYMSCILQTTMEPEAQQSCVLYLHLSKALLITVPFVSKQFKSVYDLVSLSIVTD